MNRVIYNKNNIKCKEKIRQWFAIFFFIIINIVNHSASSYAFDLRLTSVTDGPVGSKIPLILIHGLASNMSVWDNFKDYFNRHPDLKNNYQIYYYSYDTSFFGDNSDLALFNNAGILKNNIEQLDNIALDLKLNNKPLVILAHSMGGLIARSFMQQHYWTGINKQGGERVLGLITLGTPHHGAPAANYPEKIPEVKEFVNVKSLRWDSFDGNLSDQAPNYILRCINNYSVYSDKVKFNLGKFNDNSCPSISEFDRNGFYNKIIAYGGNTNKYDVAIDKMLLPTYGLDFILPALSKYSNNNDGVVPIESALFNDWPIRDRRVSDIDNCDHSDLPRGSHCLFDGVITFDKIRQDLLTFVPSVSSNLVISPRYSSYVVGQTINAQFEITNKGPEPVTVANLTIGGRDPDGQVSDFPSETCVKLLPNVPHPYTGSLTVTKTGTYSFFPAYDTLAIGTACPDSKALWNTNIPNESGNINNKDHTVVVNAAPLPTSPYSFELATQTVPSGANMLPSNSFTQTWTLKNTGSMTWGSDFKLEFVSSTDLMGGSSSVPVPRAVAQGDSVSISVNLTTPAKDGTYSGYWRMRAPNGTLFGPQLSAIINVSSISGDFKVHDWVSASGYIRIRDNASISANLVCEGGKGDDGNIVDGPVDASGLRWWKIKWDDGACKGVTDWSAQIDLNGNTQFQKIAYPTEGNIIRPKGTISKYLYKNGRKWLFKNDDIFSKMGYTATDVKDVPSGMVEEFSYGQPPIIVDNGAIIRLKGDTKKYFLLTNQRRLITSDAAYYYYMYPKGFKLEDVIDVPQAIFDMFPPGIDISTSPKVLLSAPTAGGNYVVNDKISIIWTATDDVGVSSVDISYSTNGGSNWNPIVTGVPNTTGSYLWMPNFAAPSVMIKVVAYNTSGFKSEPDTTTGIFSIQDVYRYADFTISSFTPSANSVTAGQQINLSTIVTNQGNGASTPTNIKYYYSATSTGKDYFLGELSVPALIAGDSASLPATVTIPSSNILQGYLVAVVNPDYYAAESTTANNIASSVISIIDNVPPTIKSLAFGWGTYKTGLTLPFIFDVTDNIGVKSLGFSYSTDNGTKWNTITDYFVPGSNGYGNSYYWTIPTTITAPASLLVKMTAKDASGNVSQPMTAGPFMVKDGSKPAVTILSPNGGEIFDLGSTQTIKWSVNAPNGINKMALYLYWADQAIYIADITNNTSGSYTWAVPSSSSFVTNGAKIKISIEDKNFNTNEDYSDNYFTIRDTSTPPPAPWTMPTVLTSVPSGILPYTTKSDGGAVIATDSVGNVHMVYGYSQNDSTKLINHTGPGVIRQDILYKKLTGSTWSNPVVVYSITQNTDLNGNGYHSISDLQLAVDSNNLPHIVWTDSFGGSVTDQNQNDIYYTYFNGTSWSTPLNISNSIPGAPALTALSWVTKTNLPEAKRGAASAVVNNKLYIFGGNYLISNYEFDPGLNVWTRKADLPGYGINDGGATVINNKIYAVGDPIDHNVKIYDPASNSWSTGAVIPSARSRVSVASVNGKLYAIAGGTAKNEMYDPATNSWTTMTDMPTPRGFAATAVVGNKIYVIGGVDSSSNTYNKVEVYDPVSNSWSTVAPMPTRRSGAVASVVNGRIYVIGGSEYTGISELNTVEEYDPVTNVWLTKPAMPTARWNATGGAIGSSIYIVGGYSNSGSAILSVNEQVTVSTGGSGTVSTKPSIAADSTGNVHVVWVDGYLVNTDYTYNGNPNLYYLKKDASGNWSSVSQLTTNYGNTPYITVGKNGNIHIAYLNLSGGISYITFNGSSWSAPTDLGFTAGKFVKYIKLASDSSNNLHLVWFFYDTTSSQDQVLYSHYDGTSWSTPEKVSDLLYTAYQPSIVVDSLNRPHVIFEEIYNTLGKLIYRYRAANGWSAPEQVNLNSQSVGPESSRIVISNDDHLHVVWGSGYNGSNEVFYNHAPLQGGIKDITSPTAAILAPARGEALSIGSVYTITWSATDNVGVTSVALDFTTDDGVSFTPIAASLTNSGSYQWTVKNLTSTNVQIRITAQDAAGNKGFGLSGKFSVSDKTAPTVTVISPKGGEVWLAGSVQNIQWTATDNIGVTGVDLSYSTDGMVSWYPIASSLTGASYQWTVPLTLSSNCVVKVVAKDASGNVGQNTSDWSFAIVSANRPPYQPNTPDPANSAAGVVATKTLTWSGGDPDPGDTAKYDVYLGSCGSMALVSGGQTGTSYAPQTLGIGQIYCWQVIAKDNHGNTTVGQVWMFTTERPALPVLSVSAGNVVFQSLIGKSANSQTIAIDNSGGGTLNWKTTSSAPWLNVTGASGTNSGATAISADTTGLAAGSYPAVVTITSNEAVNSPVTIPVTLFINPLTYSVTLIFSGTGSGTVTSTPPGIACNTDCMTPFDRSTNLSLNAAPAQFSLFTGWSGICTNATGSCAFIMNSDTSVTAAFNKDTAHSVRIDGATQTYYSSILGAYTSAVPGDIIKAWGTDFIENLGLNSGKSVTIMGGFDSAYSANSGFTILHGILTIGTGSVVIDKLVIQ